MKRPVRPIRVNNMRIPKPKIVMKNTNINELPIPNSDYTITPNILDLVDTPSLNDTVLRINKEYKDYRVKKRNEELMDSADWSD